MGSSAGGTGQNLVLSAAKDLLLMSDPLLPGGCQQTLFREADSRKYLSEQSGYRDSSLRSE